ncbi:MULTISPECIES: hypothetical protein [unclassified Mesorhizobium]|uniref:hypothetical protein n=1 Tax=unclassified Mesorhizobium TaxID=325217 RepID=UPI000FC9F494|nr:MULTISPECIES: hypothetical protein [unclassified Mesorhizobium]RUW67158.1 hypothetical protein EOA31_29430 [Mesorhizobium sp. M4B.F.Ca.ET.049.02.1.2]RWA60329.1 MAG: hypothetical protein EOQ27_23525 [Mesorhizobium sp.]RWC93778.1 MAG: hypothetical protein EOS32_20240 [Mesorhizobium sp.]TGV18361.1 hypothetical protein EN786_33645 [Mesorhizobium sp. M4B.F.Ca.ET.143.01.1.1]TIW74468.1 MAG: hypothetical protein E5V58_05980 [Mesorhizobium sp.]
MNKNKDARDKDTGAAGAVPRRPGAGHAPEATGLPTKGGDDPLVRFLAENTDLSPKQARELIREHGHDRQRLLEIARTMKAEG